MTDGKDSLNWSKVANRLAEMLKIEGEDSIREHMRLQERLETLPKEELVSALDEIATLDLPDGSQQELVQMLLEQLGAKDPECALTRYFDRTLCDGNMSGLGLADAMKHWMNKNPVAATAWFDQQIAAGKFDSKSLDGENPARMQFESILLGALFPTDLAAATARLKSLPVNQRSDTVTSIEFARGEYHPAYANLIRDGLPQVAQAEILARHATDKVREGYPAVTEYLDAIKATPTERAFCVEQAAGWKIRQLAGDRKVSREDIDTMREWVSSQAPEVMDKLTGTVIGTSLKANEKLSFSEAAALAGHFYKVSSNDEVLIGFLTSLDEPLRHREEAQVLAQKISDVKIREEILRRFDPPAAGS